MFYVSFRMWLVHTILLITVVFPAMQLLPAWPSSATHLTLGTLAGILWFFIITLCFWCYHKVYTVTSVAKPKTFWRNLREDMFIFSSLFLSMYTYGIMAEQTPYGLYFAPSAALTVFILYFAGGLWLFGYRMRQAKPRKTSG